MMLAGRCSSWRCALPSPRIAIASAVRTRCTAAVDDRRRSSGDDVVGLVLDDHAPARPMRSRLDCSVGRARRLARRDERGRDRGVEQLAAMRWSPAIAPARHGAACGERAHRRPVGDVSRPAHDLDPAPGMARSKRRAIVAPRRRRAGPSISASQGARRQGHGDLVALAGIAHEARRGLRPAARPGRGPCTTFVASARMAASSAFGRGESKAVEPHVAAPDDLVGDGARRKPTAEPTPALGGTMIRVDAELLGERARHAAVRCRRRRSGCARRCRSPRSTAWTRAALAMFSSTISADAAGRHHGGRAPRGRPTSASHGAPRCLGVEGDAAVGEGAGVDAAQHEVGVGHGRPRAAAAVAGRPRLGTRRCRGPTVMRPSASTRGDRAAAGADLHHLDDGDAQGQAAALHEARCAVDLEAARGLAAVRPRSGRSWRSCRPCRRRGSGPRRIPPAMRPARMAPPAGPHSTSRIGKRRAVSRRGRGRRSKSSGRRAAVAPCRQRLRPAGQDSPRSGAGRRRWRRRSEVARTRGSPGRPRWKG